MKAFYEIPELEIVAFEVEDIITTSANPDAPTPGPTQGNLNDIFDTEIPDNTDPGWGNIV